MNVILRVKSIEASSRIDVAHIEASVRRCDILNLLDAFIFKDEALCNLRDLLEQLVLVDLPANRHIERDGL